MRDNITLKAQSVEKLAATLPNFLRRIIVEETGPSVLYDFALHLEGDPTISLLKWRAYRDSVLRK